VNKGLALLLLAAAQFVVVLDASIVNVALPSIGQALDFSQDNLSWVVNAYVLVFGGFLMLGGRLADLLGRRRMFVIGLILFATASLAGGLAQSEGWLIAARAVQGLGGALLSPARFVAAHGAVRRGRRAQPRHGRVGRRRRLGRRRRRAARRHADRVGRLGVGPLRQRAGRPDGPPWPPSACCPRAAARAHRHFDVAGAVTVTAGLSLLVYALVDASDAGWLSTQTLGLGALSLALLASFVVIELRTKDPLVPFSIFKLRTLTGSNIVALLVAAALFAMFFFVSLYMQQVLGYSALKAGLSYLPLAVGIIISAGVASQLVTKVGYKPVFFAGMVLAAIGLTWFAQVDADGSYLSDILFPSLVVAVGLGFAFVPMMIAAVAGVEPARAGLASGLINTSQQVGGALGLAILASVANSKTDSAMEAAGGAQSALPQALTEGFQAAFLVGAGFAIVGAILVPC
jgi:MFS family permease